MNSFNVNLGERSYPIFFSHDRLEEMPLIFQKQFPGAHLFFVTNNIVAGIYEEKFRSIFKSGRNPIHIITIPDGEDSKSLTTAEEIFSKLIQECADRKSVVVSFGGGVIGDIAGFVAATYMRGVPFVQIPTTLLAMVDSSVGGKVAVNHVLGKNMIGAFYQPKFVFIDQSFLRTLPRRELICGLAEVIKYGLILDKEFFEWTVTHYDEILLLDSPAVEYSIKRSCELKSQVVEKDERENDIRMILNFGHTWAHAFENLGGYRKLKHGEAVLLGMLAASHVSWMNYMLNDKEFTRIEQTILPLLREVLKNEEMKNFIFRLTWDSIRAKMLSDKKTLHNNIRWVVLNRIGEAITDEQIQPDLVEKSFVYLKTIIEKTDLVKKN